MYLKRLHNTKDRAFDAYFEVSVTQNIGIQAAMTDIISRLARQEQKRIDLEEEDKISPEHVSGLFLTANKPGGKYAIKEKKCC